jgi:lysozyme
MWIRMAMQARHQVSPAAIELIKRFEGFREKAAQLPDGRWTLGYGHTLTARAGAYVSERDAEALLMYDLIGVAHAVNQSIYTPLTQNQFDALAAFAFNIGADNFRRSGVVRLINEGQLLKAACAMELWRRADFEGKRIVVDALVRRRAAEKALFLTPPEGFIPAPTPLLPPRIDREAALVPEAIVETPFEVEATPAAEPVVAVEPAEPPEAAADTVVARLEKLIAEEVTPEEAFPLEAEPTLPDAEPAAPLGEPAPVAELVAEAAPAEILEPLTPGEPGALPAPEGEVPETEPTAAAASPTLKAITGWRGKVAGLSALALVGALLLGAGIWWMFNGGAPAAGVLSEGAVGWIVGVAGVLRVAGAAYLLLHQLGRGDEELDQLED